MGFDFLEFVKDLAAGGLSGVVAKTLAAPVERVKLILQTQRVNVQFTSGNNQFYNGPIDCVKRIITDQGALSFWRGNAANIMRYFPSQAMNFAFKDEYKKWFAPRDSKNAKTWQVVLSNLLSGGMAGASSLCVTYPLDMARTRLAADIGSSNSSTTRQFSGTFDCLYKVYKQSGVSGVYGGFGAAVGGVVVFRALFLGGYDTMKHIYDLDHASVIPRYFVAQGVTTTVGTICYPLDTIRRRMMMQPEVAVKEGIHTVQKKMYSNTWDCIKQIYKNEGGIVGFYPGLSVNIIRGLSGGLLLISYDELKKYL